MKPAAPVTTIMVKILVRKNNGFVPTYLIRVYLHFIAKA